MGAPLVRVCELDRPRSCGDPCHITSEPTRSQVRHASPREGVKDDSDQRHGRRSEVLRRRRTPNASRAISAREPRQGRDGDRLRHEQLRCLHRASRRPEREVLQRPGRAGRRSRGDDHRGSGQGRPTAPDAGVLSRAPRPPVRLLHTGDDHAGHRHPQYQRQPLRGGDPRRTRGQPLPVHRLSQHRQGGRCRRRRLRRQGWCVR